MILSVLNSILLKVAKTNFLVNEAFTGDVYEINSKENKFGCFVATPMTALRSEGGTITYHYTLYYIDRLTKDEKNMDFVQSDAVMMLKGLIDKMEEEGIQVGDEYQFTLFRHQFDDWCAGAYVDVDFTVPDTDCGEFDFGNVIDLRPITITENGEYRPDGFDGFDVVIVNVDVEGKIKELEEEIKELEDQIDDLNNQIGDLNDQIGDLNDQITDLNNQITDLENQIAGKNQLIEVLRGEIERMSNLQELEITENGEYTADEDHYALRKVMVNVQGGGTPLTPEQEEAINTIVDSSKGVLYTDELKVNTLEKINTFYENTPHLVDDRLLVYISNRGLYEFKNLNLNYLGNITGSFEYYKPIWSDNSGRWYNGDYYEINPETLESTNVDLDVYSYNYDYNRHNIIKGKYGIYNYGWYDYKTFNEETQKFENNINYPDGKTVSTYDFFRNQIKYGDRIISIYYGETHEFIESEDGIYFDIIENPFDLSNVPGTVEGRRFFYIDETWYYFSDYETYKLVDDTWVRIELSGDSSYFDGNKTVVFDDLIFSSYITQLIIYNINEDKKTTFWTPTNSVAVDLESEQIIEGTKTFKSGINSSLINVEQIQSSNDNNHNLIISSADKLELRGGNINISSDNVTINGVTAATKDDLYINSTIEIPGPFHKRISDDWMEPGDYSKAYTTNGRVFADLFGSPKEFVDGHWVEHQILDDEYLFDYEGYLKNKVYRTKTDTYYCGYTNIYKFNNETGRFEFVCENTTGQSNGWWDCGDGLRYENTFKFDGERVFEDYIEYGRPNKTCYYNDQLYLLYGNEVYTWDDSTKTRNYVGNTWQWIGSDYPAVQYGNNFYFFTGTWWKFNPNIEGCAEVENIWKISPNTYDFYGLYKDQFIGLDNDGQVNIIYNITYTIPEIPEGGKYQLTGQIVDGKKVYTWEKGGSGGGITIEDVDNEINTKLTGYATESWVENKKYLNKSDVKDLLVNYATEAWVNSQGFLKQHQSLVGYATESWVNNQGFLTQHQSLKTINGENLVGTGDIEIKTRKKQFILTPNDEMTGMIEDEQYHALINYAKNGGSALDCEVYFNTISASSISMTPVPDWSVDVMFTIGTETLQVSFYGDNQQDIFITGVTEDSINEQIDTKLIGYATQQDISGKVDRTDIWTGSEDEWNLLTPEEQSSYMIALVR